MDSEQAAQLIGREAGYEVAFALARMAGGAVPEGCIPDETRRIVSGIIDARKREYPEHLSAPDRYRQFIDVMMTTYNEVYHRIYKPTPSRLLQPT